MDDKNLSIKIEFDAIDIIKASVKVARAIADRLQEKIDHHQKICGHESGAPEECCILRSLPELVEKLRDDLEGKT